MAGIILALHPEQLQSWLDKRKSAATVFTRMRLKKSESLFSEPQFSTWIRYVDDLDKLSKEEVSAVSILIAHYGDEILYEMILKAKEVAGMERLAARLQAEQMKHWIINRKNPDEVYELFHLHWPLLSSVLINPNFPAWVKYVDDLNAKHPEAHISTISTLRKQRDLNDPILVHLIGEAKAVEGFKSAATKVEDGLIDAWLNAAKSPDNALAELGFSTATYNILGNPALDTWIKYTDAFNRKYPDKGTTMFETFVRMYGEDKLALMVTAAKKNENTDDIARELESALLKKWLSSGKTIDDVYWILRLYLSRYDFSDRSNLSIWVSYLNTVVTDNPSKVSEVFTYLKKNSETHKALLRILAIARKFPKLESAAAKLQMETLQQIFARHNILSKPLFKEWMDYAIGFYKENTKKQESWFKVLRTYYADVDITSMINKAMQNPSTMEIVRKTESA
ncbi:hypothetical protein F441_13485 [Phytophthora nicotianae CJ01A1]|uniref:RxLR effector PexRD54 WY domain-containing protein n=1 Tax=Phytophthora nicotianae CJ01A1 TaxID=1317063 RepID=W2WN25_PHYNI|nr:hypothetical protein F441_13485 [Phytophthora nicotianae CJ01A1]